MTANESDPESQAIEEARSEYRWLAGAFNCSPLDVAQAFADLPDPCDGSAAALREHDIDQRKFEDAAIHMKQAAAALSELSELSLSLLALDGMGPDWLRACAADFEARSLNRQQWKELYNRKGGRNDGAYIVAEGVARLFDILGRDVRFGVSATGAGEPSTDYCRAVQHALSVFRIRGSKGTAGELAHWKGPAREAWERRDRRMRTT